MGGSLARGELRCYRQGGGRSCLEADRVYRVLGRRMHAGHVVGELRGGFVLPYVLHLKRPSQAANPRK